MINLANKKITIIGAQKSGVALSVLVQKLGGQARISDERDRAQLPLERLADFQRRKVMLDLPGHSRDFIEDSDIVVLSPGVRYDALCVQWAKEKDIPVLGEVEFAFQFCQKPIIAVTGSNGKTTVVNLIANVLKESGYQPCLCGNVGTPFSACVLDLENKDYVVLEVSSFQMESLLLPSVCPADIRGFRPFIAVLLNFNENHLDRHKDLEEYFAAKTRIFQNQDCTDYAVLNIQEPYAHTLADRLSAEIIFFNHPAKTDTLSTNPNHGAVLSVAEVLGIDTKVCFKVFEEFPGVEHRLETVRTIDDVEFINDSKATTAEALRWALNNLSKPIQLICGGKDKHIDFSPLKDLVSLKVKKIFAIGEARNKVQDTFGDVVTVEICADLKEAVLRAKDNAAKGECVLLSPMCASFDMFVNFEERGRVFKEIVNSLKG